MSEPTAVNARTRILDIIANWGLVGMIRDSIADTLEAKDKEIADLKAKLEQAQVALESIAKDCQQLADDAPEKGEQRAWRAVAIIAKYAARAEPSQ